MPYSWGPTPTGPPSGPPAPSCWYGTDIDDPAKLIANRHSVEEIAKIIGVDSLGYLSLEHVVKLADNTRGFCTACFGGGYPTAIPKDGGKDRFECKISERRREHAWFFRQLPRRRRGHRGRL